MQTLEGIKFCFETTSNKICIAKMTFYNCVEHTVFCRPLSIMCTVYSSTCIFEVIVDDTGEFFYYLIQVR